MVQCICQTNLIKRKIGVFCFLGYSLFLIPFFVYVNALLRIMNLKKLQIPICIVIAILTLYPYFRVSLFGDNRSLRFYAPASAGAFLFFGGHYEKGEKTKI